VPAPPPPPGRARRLAALAIALGCIALQVGRDLGLTALALVVWGATVAVVDRHALDRLRMPRFWIITIVVALGSGLLLGRRDMEVAGVGLSGQGLEAGVLMVLRGAFVFLLASWGARAASGAGVLGLADRVGLGSLGFAIVAAFEALPAVRDGLVERYRARAGRGRIGRARTLAYDAIRQAAALTDRFAADMAGERARFVALVGQKGSGKTTAMQGIIASLEERGLEVGGVVQPAVEAEGRREGYDVVDLRTDHRRPLARRGRDGGFEFSRDVFSWAGERLRDAHAACDVLALDEAGRLEARGEGHLAALADLLDVPGKAAVLVAAVREGCLEALAERLGRPDLTIEAPLDAGGRESAASRIAELVAEARRPPRVGGMAR
jgi:nucleoside-triphosphatase THEP1